MVRYAARACLVLATLTVVGVAPAAASVQSAVDWLEAAQNASGSWGDEWFVSDRPTTEIKDTAVVLDGLASAGQTASTAYTSGITWLGASVPESTDYRARRISALHLAGQNVSSDLTALLEAREEMLNDQSVASHPGGGWGASAGFASDVVSTALVLETLNQLGLAGGVEARNLALSPAIPAFYQFDVPADATQVRVSVFAVTGTVQVRLKQGAQPTILDQFFTISTPSTVVYPDSGLPFTPGLNWLRLDAPAGSNVWVVASWENPQIDTRIVAEAIEFVRTSQLGSGGFAFAPGGDSSLWGTLSAVTALGALRDRYAVAAELASARGYLASFQDAGGAVGHNVALPTARETAKAKLAFAAAGMAAEELAAYGALIGMQSPAGDWDGSESATGLSVRALTTVPEPALGVSMVAGILTMLGLERRRSRVASRAAG